MTIRDEHQALIDQREARQREATERDLEAAREEYGFLRNMRRWSSVERAQAQRLRGIIDRCYAELYGDEGEDR